MLYFDFSSLKGLKSVLLVHVNSYVSTVMYLSKKITQLRQVLVIFWLTRVRGKSLVSNVSTLMFPLNEINKFISIFREEATSALAGFYVGPSWLNWNLEMLVFVEGGKPENLEKNPQSKARAYNKLNPHVGPGWDQT